MVYRCREQKRNYTIISEMPYFRLWLVRHYCKSHWKLFFLARGTSVKNPLEFLLVVVSSAVVRSMPEILSKLTTTYFIFFSSNFQISWSAFSFFSFKIFLIWGLNLKKPDWDIWVYENVFHTYFFFSGFVILFCDTLFCDTKSP